MVFLMEMISVRLVMISFKKYKIYKGTMEEKKKRKKKKGDKVLLLFDQ